MKHRAFVLIGILFGVNFAPLVTRGDFPAPPNSGPRTYSIGNPLGKDVSVTPWKSADAANPEALIPSDDSTNTTTLKGFSESHLDSLFGTNATLQAGSLAGNPKIQSTKPIEKVEPRSESDDYAPQPTPVVPRKSDSKRVLLVVFGSVAILAYRKYRRSRATVPWQKPSFL